MMNLKEKIANLLLSMIVGGGMAAGLVAFAREHVRQQAEDEQKRQAIIESLGRIEKAIAGRGK